MTNQKLPKQNIIRNTGDIAPPQRTSVKSVKNPVTKQVIPETNTSQWIRPSSTQDPKNSQAQYNEQSPDNYPQNKVVTETPFIQKIGEYNNDNKVTDDLNFGKQSLGASVSLDNTTNDAVQPKIISFNHSQHIYEDEKGRNERKNSKQEYEIRDTDTSTNDTMSSVATEKQNTPINTDGQNNFQANFQQNKTDQQIAGFFQGQKKINLQSKPKKKKQTGKAPLLGFSLGAVTALFLIGVGVFASFGYQSKKTIEVKGAQAVNYLQEAKVNLKDKNFELASTNLLAAKQEFQDSQKELDKIGGRKLNLLKHIPILSKVSSGKNVVDLGENLTDAVYELSKISKLLDGIQNPFDLESSSSFSLTAILVEAQKHINIARQSLHRAEIASQGIKLEDLPKQYASKIKTIQELLPLVNDNLEDTDRFTKIFLELFGHYGPRKYLIVFQNNQEMRATGGFIGSYGLLETNAGKIEKLKVEGIYNPDGQLRVNVVPPRPIQKVSATWTTHDANWWPDFPKSAQKIAWFYEKTGGPTTDGVIAITPTVLEKMLAVTGPIEMPEYNVTITDKNFTKVIQKQVEEDYDKEENKPKKILADLTPKLFAKFFDLKNPKQMAEAVKVLLNALEEKHILLYFTDQEAEKTVITQRWAGKILNTEKDYLAVINTNINGYKTDGVIDEIINHQAKIETDGSVTDTVTITRKHRGGNTDYEWWNKVNSDYMRVYVPKGSELISASGQTREFNEPRLVYDKLGFQIDTDVAKEEKYMKIDPNSGTRIYDENNKTVFANWVYVSPHEQVTVIYKYKLPFKVNPSVEGEGGYSFLMQKQSGSTHSKLIAEIEFPFRWGTTWLHPEDMNFDKENNKFIYKRNLNTDQFIGVVFKEK